jgi:hypothetical protein
MIFSIIRHSWACGKNYWILRLSLRRYAKPVICLESLAGEVHFAVRSFTISFRPVVFHRHRRQYVNTKDGREADFFTRHRITGETQLIQVCWEMSDKKTFERELQGLKSAMAELSLSTATIVTRDDETTIDDKIKVIPIWKWLIISGDSGRTPMDI